MTLMLLQHKFVENDLRGHPHKFIFSFELIGQGNKELRFTDKQILVLLLSSSRRAWFILSFLVLRLAASICITFRIDSLPSQAKFEPSSDCSLCDATDNNIIHSSFGSSLHNHDAVSPQRSPEASRAQSTSPSRREVGHLEQRLPRTVRLRM